MFAANTVALALSVIAGAALLALSNRRGSLNDRSGSRGRVIA